MGTQKETAQTDPTKKSPSGSIFSKERGEGVRSPEKLNQYIQVVTPGTWLLAAALALVIAAVIFWGLSGTIPVYLKAKGVGVNWDKGLNKKIKPLSQEDHSEYEHIVDTVICLVDADENVSATSLDNKEALITFRDGRTASARSELYDSVPHNRSEIEDYLAEYIPEHSGWFLSKFDSDMYCYIVAAHLDEAVGFDYWKDVATVSIVTKEISPSSFLFNGAGAV